MSRALGAQARFSPNTDVHTRTFDDELVILDLRGGQYYALDRVGAHIWRSFSAGSNVADVARELASTFEVTYEQALADCTDLAADLLDKGLLQVSP